MAIANTPTSFLTLIGFGETGWGAQFLEGAIVTIEISVCSYAFGMLLGLAGAQCKLSQSRAARYAAEFYTTTVRAVPSLLLIILLFYTGTSFFNDAMGLIGLRGRVELSGFAAAVITLGFIKGAYMTEVFRGAIMTVRRGLVEAATALGLNGYLRFRFVVFPLMLRTALPGLANLWQSALKDSALVSVVGLSELLTVGKNAASETKLYGTFLCFTGLLYLLMTLVSNLGFSSLERRVNRGFH